jgi:8-oxo-dGTP pyrophosphatase MutT (NUDIX family)
VSQGEAGELPDWLRPVAEAAVGALPDEFSAFRPPAGGGRAGAVLMLFGMGESGPDVLLIERAHDMRSHAGQMAFPGGAVDDDDADEVAAALRESVEETGLDPRGVQVFASLPALYLPPSRFVVTPVLGWWHTPSPVHAVDPREVASVHRVPIAHLVAPVNRLRVRHPSGYVGAAFRLRGDLLVWGFTAGLLDRLLRVAGWEQPWDDSDPEDLPPDLTAMAGRTEVTG